MTALLFIMLGMIVFSLGAISGAALVEFDKRATKRLAELVNDESR